MDFIAGYAPSPDYATKEVVGTSGAEAHSINLGGPLEAQVFKIISDEFVGKVSFFRVYSGLVRAGDTVTLAHSGRPVKVPKLFRPQGKDQREVNEAGPGAIVATAKVEEFRVGDTLAANKDQKPFCCPSLPDTHGFAGRRTQESRRRGKDFRKLAAPRGGRPDLSSGNEFPNQGTRHIGNR